MNEPKISLTPDDPRLTAFALGELDGDERAAVSAAIAASPDLQAVVDEIRATAAQLESALAAEPAPAVPADPALSARKAAIIPGDDLRKLDGGSRRKLGEVIPFSRYLTIAGGLAAAGFAVLVAINPGRETPPRPALQDANKVLEKKSSITPQDRTVDDGLRQRSDSEAQAQELATKAAAAAALAATSPTVPANRADPAPIPAVAPGTNLAYVNTAVAPVAPTTNEVRPNLFQAGAATDASKVES
mgnify:FL=1